MALAFPRDRLHLELKLENCVGDICLAGVQETIEKQKKRANHFSSNIEFLFSSVPIGT